MTEFNASKTEYAEYQKANENYERKLAGKPEKVSIHERLQRGQQEIREREAGRTHTVTKPKAVSYTHLDQQSLQHHLEMKLEN